MRRKTIRSHFSPRPEDPPPDLMAVGRKYRVASYCKQCQNVIVYLPKYSAGPLLTPILAPTWHGEPAYDWRVHTQHLSHKAQTTRVVPEAQVPPMAEE